MAVVRITDELIGNVLSTVGKQFDKAEEQAKKLRPDIGQTVYDIIVRDYKDDINKVPKEFFPKTAQLQINTGSGGISESWDLDKPMPTPHAFPKDHIGNWYTSNYSAVSVKLDRRHKEFAAVFEQIDAWREALKQVAHDREAAKQDVKKVLQAFTTLAPALKAWPALWDLLSDYIRNKHKEIVERSKPTAPKVKVNTVHLEGLTAKLVSARITNKRK